MLEYITDIVKTIGGRPAGTEQEKQAQYRTAEWLKKYCSRVEVEPFEAKLHAQFGSLKVFTSGYFLALLLLIISPVSAALLAMVNTILFVGHFVMNLHWLDFLFQDHTSYNAWGEVLPTHEPKSVILVAGHIDSVYEFKWWYRFGHWGGLMTVGASLIIPLQAFTFGAVTFSESMTFRIVAGVLFLVLSPLLLAHVDMQDKNVPVDGALDNLTGVAMGVEMVKYFSENPLKHTIVRAVSFGAEEPGMRGSEAFADAHYDKLIEEKAFLINVDTTKDVDQIAIVRSELRTMTFFDKAAIGKMEQSFVEENVAVKKVDLLIGNTDAASFDLEDLPCISIIGLDNDKLDPTYHTRLDNLDNYNPEASRLVSKVLVHYIKKHDAEMSNL